LSQHVSLLVSVARKTEAREDPQVGKRPQHQLRNTAYGDSNLLNRKKPHVGWGIAPKETISNSASLYSRGSGKGVGTPDKKDPKKKEEDFSIKLVLIKGSQNDQNAHER